MSIRFARTAAAAAFAGAILMSAAAGAQTVRVSYLPGELSSVAGLHRVMARIHHIAQRACEAEHAAERAYRYLPCRTELAAGIVAQIGDARLTALWQDAAPRVQLASRGR